MSENKKETNDTEEYQFIKEKIIAKKRSKKWKKILSMFGGTLLLACTFGCVSRYFFVASEPVVYKILGVTPTPTEAAGKTPIYIPSEQPDGSTPTPTVKGGNITPSGTAQASVSPTEAPAVSVTPEVTPVVVENTIAASLDDYIAIHQEIRKLATQVSSSLVTVTTVVSGVNWFEETFENRSSTTGIILGNNSLQLLILVPYDKLMDATRIEVDLGSSYLDEAVLVDYDTDYNLAVIGIDYKSIPEQILSQVTEAEFGESYYLVVGTPILAVGNPNGYMGSYEVGTITSKNIYHYIADDRLDVFSTSLEENSNGEGVIVNLKGQIIGIITHTMKDELSEPISTAVGISDLKSVIENLANGNDITSFGVVAEEMPEDALNDAELINGIYVNSVIEGSPAEAAGIKKGDIIYKVDETTIISVPGLHNDMQRRSVGDEVKVYIKRESQQTYKEVECTVVIGCK